MTPKKAASIASLSFEEAYERLEQVISMLEAGELDLDQSIALYEEGMRLAEICEHKLDDAQLQVTKLLSRAENEHAEGAAAGDAPPESTDDDAPAKDSGNRQTPYLTFVS